MSSHDDGPDGKAGPPTFAVVGIGASAGGLEAMSALFDNVPDQPGVAFVVVPHQHPGYVSLLPELIGRHTALPTGEAVEGTRLEPNRVYVAPSTARLAIINGTVRLFERPADHAFNLPIDFFLRSLGADLHERAIAVLLSGSGSDGTVGAKTVKAEGGLVLAQDPATAEHQSMPRSVIDAGQADRVLAPGEMMDAIRAYNTRIRSRPQTANEKLPESELQKILVLIRDHTGRDFCSYKPSTIRRRIERRLAVHQLESATEYTTFLEANPHEIDRLFKDLLIGVTTFFRDPDVWRALAKEGLEPLLRSRKPGRPLRIWVPGCSSGEEAYTIAMLATELGASMGGKFDLQIFATDLDAEAIAIARRAVYPNGIAADVTPDRLERFFVRDDDHYRVRPEVRDRVVFAPHDLLSDPPFTRLDLLSCRNVLIYMEQALQERLLPMFHYSLANGGLLLLGTSETIGRFSSIFAPINARARLFRRIGGPSPARALSDLRGAGSGGVRGPVAPLGPTTRSIAETVERILTARYLPPSIVVNEQGDIVHIYGRTGLYLEPAPGRPSHNAFVMARPGLQLALTTLVRKALAQHEPVVQEGVEVRTNGDFSRVTVSAETLTRPASVRGLVLVSFAPEPPRSEVEGNERLPGDATEQVQALEQEVQRSHEHLQRTIEELESSNEELQSMNEELQSANEELETSKEEMHSLNEELQTVNVELQEKVTALSQVNDDMTNLLNSTEIATIFLDRKLQIKRFTRPAQRLIHLIDSDIGRPLGDLASSLAHNTLVEDAATVLRTLTPIETEVQARDGRDYLMRILPYRTTDNVIDGLVVTFIDTSELTAAKASSALARSIVATVRHPLVVLDGALRVISVNPAFCHAFAVEQSDIEGILLYQACHGAWELPKLRRLLEEILPHATTMENFVVDQRFPVVGPLHLVINAQQLKGPQPERILLAIEATPTPANAARQS